MPSLIPLHSATALAPVSAGEWALLPVHEDGVGMNISRAIISTTALTPISVGVIPPLLPEFQPRRWSVSKCEVQSALRQIRDACWATFGYRSRLPMGAYTVRSMFAYESMDLTEFSAIMEEVWTEI